MGHYDDYYAEEREKREAARAKMYENVLTNITFELGMRGAPAVLTDILLNDSYKNFLNTSPDEFRRKRGEIDE